MAPRGRCAADNIALLVSSVHVVSTRVLGLRDDRSFRQRLLKYTLQLLLPKGLCSDLPSMGGLLFMHHTCAAIVSFFNQASSGRVSRTRGCSVS